MMKIKLSIICLMILVSACRESTYKTELTKALQVVVGDTIEFSSNLEFNKYNINKSRFDTYTINEPKKDFKLITYAPDITCTPCLLSDLRPWYMLIDSKNKTLNLK